MLSENIKKLRIAKGLSQENLAIKLNIVRQTVSKWEKGLSVPDSQMLIRLAQELDTSVNVLLGETVEVDDGTDTYAKLKQLAENLELPNSQIAKQNELRRKTLRAVFIAMLVIVLGVMFFSLASHIHYFYAVSTLQENVSAIGGYDGPTDIYVSSAFNPIMFIVLTTLAVVFAVGIYFTRRK